MRRVWRRMTSWCVLSGRLSCFGYGLKIAKSFFRLPQCDKELGLISIFKNADEQLESVCGIVPKRLSRCVVMRSVSHCPFSFASLTSIH
jgi:hypothetical protein